MYYDGKPFKVILDTGASSTVFDIELIRACCITLEQATFAGGGLGTAQAQVYQLPDRSIKVGRLSVSNIQPYAMDISHVNQSLTERNIDKADGILGSDILIRYHAIIDYESNNIYLLNK